MTIEDIIRQQGYNPPRNGTAYLVTLIWYPDQFPGDNDPGIYISDDDDDDLPSLKAIFEEPPAALPHTAPDSDSNTKHKRKISTAIPTRERPNAREKDAARGDDDVRAGDDVAPRRSGRARKATAKGSVKYHDCKRFN
jgi:hypothetical protein